MCHQIFIEIYSDSAGYKTYHAFTKQRRTTKIGTFCKISEMGKNQDYN